MEKTFADLGLDSKLIEGLKKSEIINPTHVQIQAIPLIMENKEVVAQSETGTGKTLAYLLPIFQKTDLASGMQTIILAPTHELAAQIKKEVDLLAKNSEINVTAALIIGEVNITRQIDKLKTKPNIIVGSPGRILELIEKKKITAHTIKSVVIDEADYLLNKKNVDSVNKILKAVQKNRQLMMFSASISNITIGKAKEMIVTPEFIKIDSKNVVSDRIKHSFYVTEHKKRIDVLRRLIEFLKPEKSLVFVKQGEFMEQITEKNKYHGKKIGTLFGTLDKEERKKILDEFRKGKIEILFATDIAARGLDIKGITHIFNIGLLEDSKTYLHRCGRTGRQNATGEAISIITADEKALLKKFEKELKVNIEEKKL